MKQRNYTICLTPYAARKVEVELHKATSVTVILEGCNYIAKENGSIRVVNQLASSCTCPFNTCNRLPCRHIFSARLYSGQSLIERELFANRWQKTFQNIEEDTTASSSPKNIVIMTPTKKQKILSTPQKYTCFLNVAKNMASLNSQIGQKQFNARLEQMENLYNLWLEQKDVVICEKDHCNERSSTPQKDKSIANNPDFVGCDVSESNVAKLHSHEEIQISMIYEDDVTAKPDSFPANASLDDSPCDANKKTQSAMNAFPDTSTFSDVSAASSTHGNDDGINTNTSKLCYPNTFAAATALLNDHDDFVNLDADHLSSKTSSSDVTEKTFVLKKRMKMRGRPAGRDQSVIRLPARKKLKQAFDPTSGPENIWKKQKLSRNATIPPKDVCRSVGGTPVKNCNLQTLENDEWLDDQVCITFHFRDSHSVFQSVETINLRIRMPKNCL